MIILIDTNILIPLEDTGRILDQKLANLRRTVDMLGYQFYIHPAQIDDILRDPKVERRELFMSRIDQYPRIPNPPVLDDVDLRRYGWSQASENDRVDNMLLHALARNAAHILITEDNGIRTKGRRAGILERIYRLDQALDFLQPDRSPVEFQLPMGIRCRYLYELDVSSSFFDSLREGYPSFNNWYSQKSLEHRQCWSIADDVRREIHAICIYKDEASPVVTDAGCVLNGRVLKLCTIKVGEPIQGRKIGERLLYTAFKYAVENGFDWVYVHTDVKRHEQLVELCLDYGFENVGDYNNDSVFAKPMRPGLLLEPEPALDYAIQCYPHYRIDSSVRGFLVPIRPAFHEDLFPDISNHSIGLFANEQSLLRSQSNTIKKAYICNSNATAIAPGDVLFFYRSQDRRSVEVVGVVEDALRTSDVDMAMSLVAKRTVYSREQLSEILSNSESGALIILFRLMQYIEPVKASEMEAAGVKGPYLTVRSVPMSVFIKSKDGH